jgi:Uma2 family endonuclease
MDGTDVASTDVVDTDTTRAGVAVAHGMTVAELHAMEGTDDGRRWELIDGELFVSPAPNFGHQGVLRNMFLVLVRALGERRVFFAPLDIQVGPQTVVQPDVVVFTAEDEATMQPDEHVRDGLIPQIAVEVSSPSTRRLDIIHKRRLYEDSGVAEYWFVDREAEVVDVYAFGADDDLRTCAGAEQIASDLVELDVTVAELLAW